MPPNPPPPFLNGGEGGIKRWLWDVRSFHACLLYRCALFWASKRKIITVLHLLDNILVEGKEMSTAQSTKGNRSVFEPSSYVYLKQ